MLSGLASLLVLAAMGAPGVVFLRRAVPSLDRLEQLAYGMPLGVIAVSYALLGGATAFGLSAALVLTTGALSLAAAALLARPLVGDDWLAWIHRAGSSIRHASDQAGQLQLTGETLALLVIAAIALRWVLLWSSALFFQHGALWAGQVYIWDDWYQHLSALTSFAFGDNFPPQDPMFAGHPFAYHYLASLTAAAMVELGMGPTSALTLHSFVFSLFIALGLLAFARRLTLGWGASVLAVVLFLFGGAPSWVAMAGDVSKYGLLDFLTHHPWDQNLQQAANIQWQNMYFAFIEPQRGYLYGVPLCLLTLTLLLLGIESRRWEPFVLAAGVAGLLPLAHLSTLLALAAITPFLFLLFPSRRWLLFFGLWGILVAPQVLLQEGGGPGPLAAVHLQIGWIAPPDNWIWFWLKNLGLFIPLLILALATRDLLPDVQRRFLWGFMPIFVLTNLIVFQPWDVDNEKMLLYWFVAVCVLVAAVTVWLWRRYRHGVARAALVLALGSMLLSGFLLNLDQALGNQRYQMLSAEEVALAARVRATTPPGSVFAIGLQLTHPIDTLTGRPVVLSFPGTIWARGLDYLQTQKDLFSLYAYGPDAPALIKKYHIHYVVIGPYERTQMKANTAAFQTRYRVILRTPNYQIFDVSSP